MGDDGGLSGRSILVTGGASGIGRATSLLLAEKGARVAVLDRDDEALARMKAETASRDISYHRIDVTDDDALRALARELEDEPGELYGVFNNAGVMGRPVDWTVPDACRLEGIDVNLFAPYLVVRAFLHLLRARGGGVIVNNASITAVRGSPENPGYAAAKAGLIGLSRSMARALGRFGVRVHCICPSSVVGTALWRNSFGGDMPLDSVMAMTARASLGRLLTPNTVASLVAHLMAPEFSSSTNTLIFFDQP